VPPGLEAPDVPDTNIELAIAKLGHGVLTPSAPSSTAAAVTRESAERPEYPPQQAVTVASGSASSTGLLRFADMFPALEPRQPEGPAAWEASSAPLDLGEPQKVDSRLGMHFNRVQYWGPSMAWEESSGSGSTSAAKPKADS